MHAVFGGLEVDGGRLRFMGLGGLAFHGGADSVATRGAVGCRLARRGGGLLCRRSRLLSGQARWLLERRFYKGSDG
jgi:hypothetical protein